MNGSRSHPLHIVAKCRGGNPLLYSTGRRSRRQYNWNKPRASRVCALSFNRKEFPMIRAVAALLIAAVSAVAIAQAPANPPVRIRGTVEKIDGTNLTVKANNGQSMNVKLADNYVVVGIAKASLADVAGGKFIGTTTLGERDGALVAIEVHIFPENMRGTGEGHYDWDLRPTSKMTNANVANVTSMGKDRVLTVQYKGG